MITPPYLKAGDEVRIVSTARKIEKEIIDVAVGILKSWGLKVSLGKNLFKEDNQYAGSDRERLADLQSALDDKKVKAIFCARGGYGSLRIIDDIKWTKFKKSPKWVIGYSDITILHCHIQQVLGIESMHATMPINFPDNDETDMDMLSNVLTGIDLHYEITSHKLNRIGSFTGEIVGGNLSILYALKGSKSFPETKKRILFIEDLDEYLYHVDRMIVSLKRAGTFDKLGGLIVGGMTEMNDNTIPFGQNAEEIIRSNLDEFKFPIIFDFPAGHIKHNDPIILGRKAEMEVGEKVSLLNISS